MQSGSRPPNRQGHIQRGLLGSSGSTRGGQLLEAGGGAQPVCVALRSSEPENGCRRSQGVLGAAGLSKAAEPGWAPASPSAQALPPPGQHSSACIRAMSVPPAHGDEPWSAQRHPGPTHGGLGPRGQAVPAMPPHWGTTHCTNPAAPCAPWRQPLLFLPESGATSCQRPPPESSP